MLRYFPITGRLVLSDDLQDPPHVIFDTDDAFLCVKPSDVKIGSQIVPARTASSQGVDGSQIVVDVETTYFLAQIDIPGAKVVRGMMRTTWDSNPEPADNLWRQASGTHLDILDGVSTTQVPQSDLSGYDRVATMGGYTFEVTGFGSLILRERIVMRARDPGSPPTTFNRARRQATISFRLLIGFFLNQDPTDGPQAVACGAKMLEEVSSSTRSATFDVGYEFPGRRLCAFLHTRNTNIPTGVTIGGVTAAKRSGDIPNGSTSSNGITTVWDALVETGTTAEVVATRSGTLAITGCDLFGVANVSGDPPTITSNSDNLNALSLEVTVGAGEVAIVSANCSVAVWLGDPINFLSLDNVEWKQTLIGDVRGGSGYLPENSGAVTATGNWSGPVSGGGFQVIRAIVAVKYAA